MKRPATPPKKQLNVWQRIPKTWRTITILVLVLVLIVGIFQLLIVPRIEHWVLSKFPEAFAIKQQVEAKFPGTTVGMSDQTLYGNGQAGKVRTITFSVTGKQYLVNPELNQIQDIICAQLGDKAKDYQQITLQSVVEKRFLIFYSRTSQTKTITCPTTQPTK